MEPVTSSIRADAGLRSAIPSVILGGAFVALAASVVAHRRYEVDAAVTNWFVDHRTPALTGFLRLVSFLGYPPQSLLIAALIVGLVWWRSQEVAPTVVLAGMALFASLLSSSTKLLVARERPPADIRLAYVRSYSFPSGHVTTTTVLAVGLLVVTAGALTGAVLWLARVVAVVAVVLMAVSRMYLGVHWFSDVVGGALLGAAVAMLGAVLLARLRAASPAGQLPRSGAADGSPDRYR
jgi:undecaprenyl-diphosphatase